MHKKNRKFRFGSFLLIWAIVLLVLGAGVCVLTYSYAGVYEVTRPELAIEAMLNSTSKDEWRELLADSLPEEYTDPGDKELYGIYFDTVIKDLDFSYRKDMNRSDENENVYVIYSGVVNICRVSVVPGEGGHKRLGRSEWQTGAVETESFKEKLETFSVSIVAYPDSEIAVNGVVLGEEYITDREASLGVETKLEKRYVSGNRPVGYTYGPIFTSATVTADGVELLPESVSDGVYYYVVPIRQYSFKAEAPEGIDIYVNGTKLGENEMEGTAQNIFRGLKELYIKVPEYETYVYSAQGLHIEPTVTAIYNGEELTPEIGEDGVYYYFYPSDENIPQAAIDWAEDFFNEYLKYASKEPGASMHKVLGKCITFSEVYTYITQSEEALYWASETDFKLKELNFSNFHMVSTNCFTCTVSYDGDFEAQSWYEEYSYSMRNGYKLVFIKTASGAWGAATMTAYGS